MQLSEQEVIRREKLNEIIQLGINPYPPELFEVNASAKDILENYERNKVDYKNIEQAYAGADWRAEDEAGVTRVQHESED